MRDLIKMAGVTFEKRHRIRRFENKGVKKKIKSWSKATTTPLVKDVFETFFPNQIAVNEKEKEQGFRRKRCGVCEACQLPDCGTCSFCRDKLKFGGTGRGKQACKLRRCPYMMIQEAEESENEDEEEEKGKKSKEEKVHFSKRILHKIEWIGEDKCEYKGRMYYRKAKVGDVIIEEGDYVLLNSEEPNHPLYVAQVAYLWDDKSQGATFHAHMFCRATDTILGETADPRELFVVDDCENCPLGSIVRKAKVNFCSKL